MINEERMLNRFLEYVQIDSESNNEKNFRDRLVKDLSDLGLEVHVDEIGKVICSNGSNIIATLKGNAEGEPILFSCHMDTVTPGNGIKPIIKDGIVYSDGTTILGADDKGGIASIIETLAVIKEKNIKHPTVQVVFTVAEEIGLLGSKNLDYSKIEAKKAYVLDSGGDPGYIVTKGPAQDVLNVKLTGKLAHAGVCPEEGVSAIEIASHAISNMKLLRIDEDTTANIGTISGGVATNIVCPEVSILAEARSTVESKLDEQTKHMVDTFNDSAEKFGGKAHIEVTRMYGAFTVEEDDDIVLRAKKAFDNLGIKGCTMPSGGGSDTNIFNGNKIKAVNLACGERKPHTLEESVKIEDLGTMSKVILELIKESLI